VAGSSDSRRFSVYIRDALASNLIIREALLEVMIILPGPSSIELGRRIASELGVQAHPVENRVFPDGENYIRVNGDLRGEDVAIIQTTAVNPDSKLMQLLLTASTARDLGAERIIAVVPYLAYSRQDKRFLDGEALSLDVVFKLLEGSGVNELIVVDVHNDESIHVIEEKHSINVHNLSAFPLLAKHLDEQGYAGAWSFSPDKGAIHHAEVAAKVLGGPTGFFEKTRDRQTGEITMSTKTIDVEGKKAIVFDDIISSGGTMAMAVSTLKSHGADKVVAACSHALFIGGAEEKIRKAGADLMVASDTVETPYSKVTVAGIIAEKLQWLD